MLGAGIKIGQVAVRGRRGAPAVPTLDGLTAFAWASGATDNFPDFTVGVPATAQVGWVLRISFGGVTYLTYTIQAGDIGNSISATASADAVPDGAHIFSARFESGGQFSANSTAAVTIDTTPPSITSASSATIPENSTLAFTVTTSENATVAIGGADAALFELASNPSSTSRILRWAGNTTRNFESPADSGGNNVYNITLTPTDAAGNVGSAQSWTGTVTNVNEGPSVANAIPDQSATIDTPFSFQFASNTFSDPDAGDTLSYTASLNDNSPLPAWLSFTAATRTFSGTPASGDAGTIAVKVTATDGGGLTATDTFNLTASVAGVGTTWISPSGTDWLAPSGTEWLAPSST